MAHKYETIVVGSNGVRKIRGNTSLRASDFFLIIDNTTDTSIYLPDPSVLRDGRSQTINNVNDETTLVKVIPPGSVLINSAPHLIVFSSATIFTDGVGYFSLDYKFKHDLSTLQTTEFANGNSGATKTIDQSKGTHQSLVLTGSPSCTLTLVPPAVGVGSFVLRLVQGAGGSKTVIWPSIKWAGGLVPVLSNVAGAEDIIVLRYFGATGWYGQASTGFATV